MPSASWTIFSVATDIEVEAIAANHSCPSWGRRRSQHVTLMPAASIELRPNPPEKIDRPSAGRTLAHAANVRNPYALTGRETE